MGEIIKAKFKIEFFAFKSAISLMKLLPYGMAKNMLISLSTALKIRGKVATKNLKMVFPKKPDKEIKIILKGMYKTIATNIAEIYLADKAKLYKSIKIDGWKNLEEALSLGKGVILASGHLGNWELAGAYIASKHNLSVVIKKQKNPLFNDYTVKMRQKDNIKMIYKKRALRGILKDLKNNYIVTILFDQDAGRAGIRMNFLGHLASVFTGAAKIALMTGAPIVPAFALRDEKGNNFFILEKPIYIKSASKNDELIKEITLELSQRLEKHILKYPQQWFWVHRRWKGANKAREEI